MVPNSEDTPKQTKTGCRIWKAQWWPLPPPNGWATLTQWTMKVGFWILFHPHDIYGWVNGWMNGLNEWINGWMNAWMHEWMNECMNGWMNAWMDEWMHEWMNECMNAWMDEWMHEWMNEWMDGWMNEWMNGLRLPPSLDLVGGTMTFWACATTFAIVFLWLA